MRRGAILFFSFRNTTETTTFLAGTGPEHRGYAKLPQCGAQKFKRDFARLVSAATDDKGKSCTRMLLGELKAALDAPGESVRVAVPCMTLRMTFWSQMS